MLFSHLSMWRMQAWNVVHLSQSGKNVFVDVTQAFTNDVMNGVKVVVVIEGAVAHYVAQVLTLIYTWQYSVLCCKACESACTLMQVRNSHYCHQLGVLPICRLTTGQIS